MSGRVLHKKLTICVHLVNLWSCTVSPSSDTNPAIANLPLYFAKEFPAVDSGGAQHTHGALPRFLSQARGHRRLSMART